MTTTASWHGIGTKIDDMATSVIKDTDLDWSVEQRPLYIGEPVNVWDEEGVSAKTRPTDSLVKSHVANFRPDTNEVLGVVGSNYQLFQNDELAALVEAVEENANDDTQYVESAMSLRGGRDVFFLLKNSSFELPGEDVMHTYHLFGNNHAGERSVYILPTSIRVVCSNTLNMAMNEAAGRGYKIRHTVSMKDRIGDAIEQMKRSKAAAESFRVQCEALAAKRLSFAEIEDFFGTVYNKHYGETPKWSSDMSPGDQSKITRKEEIIDQWNSNSASEFHRTNTRSAWNGMNAVTEWVDHGRTVRGDSSRSPSRERRIHSNLLGSAAKMKAMGFEEALALL